MASGLYNSFKTGLMIGKFNLTSDTIKVALMSSTYPAAFSASSQIKWSDVSSYEISSSSPTVGYITGGATITCSVAGTSTAQFDTTGTDGSGNCTWSSATITAYGAVIYDSSATNSPLIAWIDFGGIQSSTNGNFIVSWTSQSNVVVSMT
jgi:hypothetical protein